MKKLITVLTMVAATVALTVAITACKKEEPQFNGDFTNLSLELLESAIDVDSALVIDKLTKDGFVWDDLISEYINNSYGLHYSFEYENKKIKTANGSKQEGYTKEQMKEFFKSENNKASNKNLALFRGESFESWEKHSEIICEKNPTTFNNIVEETENEHYSTYYANNEKGYEVNYSYLTSGPKVKYVLLRVQKSSSDSFIYQEASSYCEN